MNDFEYRLLLHKAKTTTEKDSDFNKSIQITYTRLKTKEHYKSIARVASIRTILLAKGIGSSSLIHTLLMLLVEGLVQGHIELQDIPAHIQWQTVAMGCNHHKSESKWRTRYRRTRAYSSIQFFAVDKTHPVALTKLQALKPLIRNNPEAFTQRIKDHGSKLP